MLSSQGCGSSDDPFNLTSLVDSLESNPFELSELMAACNEIKEKAELNGTTPILEQVLVDINILFRFLVCMKRHIMEMEKLQSCL